MPSTKLKDLVKHDRNKYLIDWSNGNSQRFEEDLHYEWMSNHIDGYTRILEVGCGDGRATLELAKKGHMIISVDENPACLEATKARLEASGFSVEYIKRESIHYHVSHSPISVNGYKYSIDYDPIPTELNKEINVYLIEGDVLNDKNLFNWLESGEKFDAVICWLIGTNGARAFNEAIDIKTMPTPAHYRIFVQNKIYELADVILNNNGILNIVDRIAEPDTPELIGDLVNSHKDQASVTSLIVCDNIEFQQYRDPDNGYDVGSVVTLNGEIRNQSVVTVLASITSKKP